jgi:hypothetical protein
MSVDTTLVIGSLVEEAYAKSSDERNWLNTTATIDLKALGRESLIHNFANRKDEYKPAYFYDNDGDTQISEDKYGTKLYAVPIAEFVRVFRQECNRSQEENGVMSRRLAWALPLLTRMKNYRPLENLYVVLFYH